MMTVSYTHLDVYKRQIMMGAPSTVEQKQLDELHIAIVGEVEKDMTNLL